MEATADIHTSYLSGIWKKREQGAHLVLKGGTDGQTR